MTVAFRSSPLEFEPAAREAALSVVALAATLLFAHGQTTERTVVTAERLGRALGAALGALARRWLSGFSNNPFIQPLCAALIAGAVAAGAAISLHQTIAVALVAFCPCMVLVPGPHLLNGAIDLARTRIALGIARLTYAGIILLVICFGLLLGFTASGATLPVAGPSAPVPLLADVIAAGCAVASFGTFFSMPWRMLPFPIVAGMLGHAARWALISLAGANGLILPRMLLEGRS